VTAPDVRAALRHDLRVAMKAGQREVVSALRTAIAAIDNAEAVDVTAAGVERSAGPVARATSGVGSSEVARRELRPDEVRDVLRRQVDEHRTEADRYDALGQPDAAARLRRQADALLRYVG
jgi:uncharacterized protein YqeY